MDYPPEKEHVKIIDQLSDDATKMFFRRQAQTFAESAINLLAHSYDNLNEVADYLEKQAKNLRELG